MKPALSLREMLQKVAYVPPPPPPQDPNAQAGMMPPPGGDPNAQAAMAQAAMPPPPAGMPGDPGVGAGAPPPPMPGDPAMAGGAMPPPPPGMAVDPATGMPIDPNTGMPMDPNAQGGGQPPPMDPSQMPIMLTYADLQQILMDALDAKGGDKGQGGSQELAQRVDNLEQLVAEALGASGKMPADQLPPEAAMAAPEKLASLNLTEARLMQKSKRDADIRDFHSRIRKLNGLQE